MDWKRARIPSGSKLFLVHNFAFMHAGKTYLLEVDEYNDGSFTGHGEQSTDKSHVVESVSGKTMQECVEALVGRIQKRG